MGKSKPKPTRERKRKAGCVALFFEVPIELRESLWATAKRNKRSLTQETILAVENHIKAEATKGGLK